MDGRWVEVADRVFVRRHTELDLNTGLVLGDERCLVIDTRGDEVQGAELAAAVRGLTPLPWSVVLTHAHFDHSFGTAAFGDCPVYAHERCASALAAGAEADREAWSGYYREQGRPAIAEAIQAARVVPPSHPVTEKVELDLGGRVVELLPVGFGHTDHDLLVRVPDVDVVFAGDLVEQGAPPAFKGSWPLRWPEAVEGLLGLRPAVVVPGHGEPVDRAFVREQLTELGRVAELCAAVAAGELEEAVALRKAPYPEDFMSDALESVRNHAGPA
ncbi:glyoxylase-like metal-dependent hydrolase (beta-lactamase superfamily II) [Crossiella equi]|uniref:Glyoxylase-like metal-dependent hydrolase (Beta-lactamase superfamily II) n=1 Tax=Crossiella equi TaxID=130796 RepID=A0ABS5AEV5_9PSEU|nr:MBL fold metallo-hydrolase [Crossiella equi]MBP2474220.1 glyoxylase-like metal-dependent hydrolase (beta-lactamase superfamily II) [Crossiella equi]